MHLRDRQILKIALPSIVSNITVPLLGIIDVAIVGHMGSAVFIGAVAVGSMVFSLVYWLFGFLRMSTTGLTAQALGHRDLGEVTQILVRSAVMALLISTLLIVAQEPLRRLMFWLIAPTADVAPLTATYFYIVIWGAPASLVLFCLMGWFVGMGNTRIPMFVSIVQNIVNIVVSLTLVGIVGMKLEGVACGTVIAQYTGLVTAGMLLVRYYGKLFRAHLVAQRLSDTLHFSTFTSSFLRSSPSTDLFLRTFCLVAVNLFFTSAGARQGAVLLSVNTIIMQLYLFFSYFMDGFANAGEALGGRYYGAGNDRAFRETLRRLFLWAAVVTAGFTMLYVVGDMVIVGILTDETTVRTAAADFMWWAWLIPAAGAAAFIWDGIFVGITATRAMLVSSFVATAAFFAVYYLAAFVLNHQECFSHCFCPTAPESSMLNHALLLAQVVFLAMRGLLQSLWYKYKISASLQHV